MGCWRGGGRGGRHGGAYQLGVVFKVSAFRVRLQLRLRVLHHHPVGHGLDAAALGRPRLRVPCVVLACLQLHVRVIFQLLQESCTVGRRDAALSSAHVLWLYTGEILPQEVRVVESSPSRVIALGALGAAATISASGHVPPVLNMARAEGRGSRPQR